MNFSKMLLTALVSLASATAAQAQTFQCSLVDEFDSWSVYVNPERDTAIFFDNDHNIAMGLVKAHAKDEGMNTPVEYLFSGQDGSNLVEEFTLSVYMNGTVDGSLVVAPGTRDEETHAMTCEVMKRHADSITWDEAKEALRNAAQNRGSTRF